MKRRLFVLFLLCLLLTGCGGKAKIGLCLAGPDSDAAWLEDCLKDAGYQVVTETAGLDQGLQNRQMTQLQAECDLLVVEPVMARQVAALAEKPVLFVGKVPAEEALSWKKTAYVGLSFAQAGQAQGRLASQLPGADLNGDGVICYAVLAGPEGDRDALAMEAGCRETLDGTCLGISYGQWTREDGRVGTAKLLATWGKDLEVVLCQDSELAKGAMEAIADGGRTVGEDIFLVSMGSSQMDKLLVKSGDLSGVVAPDTENRKTLVLDTAGLLLAGKPTPKQQYGEYIPITKENVENYLD